MEPQVLREIQWAEYGQTVLHPMSIAILLAMALFLIVTNRTYVLIPFLIVGAFLTHMQRLVIGSFDFSMLRLLMIAGVVRVAMRPDGTKMAWSRMDSVFVAYVVVASVTNVLLWQNTTAVVNRLGFAFEALLAFFLVRSFVRSDTQVITLIRGFAFVFLAMAFFMFVEHRTGYNTFSVFGGVGQYTRIREGKLRAQGAFSHAIMAGTFGATFLPLFWGLWWARRGRYRHLALIGGVSAVAITFFSSSSGPVISLLASIFAIAMWRFRQFTRVMRQAFVVMLIVLDMVMQARVWHLISRVDLVGGSTGWHRYNLIDNTIRRFSEWALVGVRTTGHWGWGLNDVTNHFVVQAVSGGILTLIAFILVVRWGFKSVSKAIKLDADDLSRQKMHWAWGSVLFSHVVSFFGVSYFGQMNFFWYLSLGVIACLPALASRQEAEAPVRVFGGEPEPGMGTT